MALAPNEPFEIEKSIWSDLDFDRMGWHDVHIHAIAFSTGTQELLMDIDYMFAWVDPEPPDQHYTFWMAPCTLIFSNVHDFSASIEWGLGLEILDVTREDKGRPQNADHIRKDREWRWEFDCQEGTFSFHSDGFVQIARHRPKRAKAQAFPWDERGGVSFCRSPFDQPKSEPIEGSNRSIPAS